MTRQIKALEKAIERTSLEEEHIWDMDYCTLCEEFGDLCNECPFEQFKNVCVGCVQFASEHYRSLTPSPEEIVSLLLQVKWYYENE